MPKVLLKKIRDILLPFLGSVVTDSSIRVNCQRMGIIYDITNNQQLIKFAEKLKITLLLFLSKKETEEITQKIKNLKIRTDAS